MLVLELYEMNPLVSLLIVEKIDFFVHSKMDLYRPLFYPSDELIRIRESTFCQGNPTCGSG